MFGNTLRYFHYYKNKKLEIFFSFFLSLLQAASLVPVAVIIQRIFDHALIVRHGNELLWLLFAMFFLFVINALAILWNRKISHLIVKDIVAKMRQELVMQTFQLSRQNYASEDIDVIHAKIINDSERIDWVTSTLLTQFFPGIFIVSGLSCFLLYENPLLFLFLACTLPVFYGAGKLVGRKVKKQIRQFHEDFSYFSKGILFVLKFNELIKLSTAESTELQRQTKNIQNLRLSSQKLAWIAAVYTVIQNNILVLSGVAVLLIGGLQVSYGAATIGSLLSFYVALNFLSSQAGNIINSIPAIIEGKESLDTIAALMGPDKSIAGELKSFFGFEKQITFRNVAFTHSNSQFSIANINFVIKKNEVFGIFGASGSGKSTLINLLLGFYKPNAGEISIDSQMVGEIDPIEYRKRIGVLFQDLLIFSGTIKENLTYGLKDVDSKFIETICRYCNIHDHIQSLEKGYNTEIGEYGIKLSGGQKQRIAIARALLRNPEILILDEPDNNLDEAMFVDILKNIRRLPITIIVISHNKDLYQYFDNIYQII